MPAEFACHLLVTVLSFVNCNYLMFMFCLPLALYHMVQFMEKKYKVYAVTREEYKPIRKEKLKCIEIKIGYYAILIVMSIISLMMAAGNLVSYHIFGDILISPDMFGVGENWSN